VHRHEKRLLLGNFKIYSTEL